jgi:hypothetical protein
MLGALAEVFLEAVSDAGTRRIVYVDGPAVLGLQAWNDSDRRHAVACLEKGLRAAMKAKVIDPLPVRPLVALLAAAFTEAATVLGGDREEAAMEDVLRVFSYLFSGLRGSETDAGDEAPETTE